jgi:hypothetical protein
MAAILKIIKAEQANGYASVQGFNGPVRERLIDRHLEGWEDKQVSSLLNNLRRVFTEAEVRGAVPGRRRIPNGLAEAASKYI